MAQSKAKMQKGIVQKHLHSRISYLYQAATYLANVADQSRARTSCISDGSKKFYDRGGELQCAVVAPEGVSGESLPISPIEQEKRLPKTGLDDDGGSKDFALSRQLLVHLQAVSLRSQVRLTPAVKHTMCKRCCMLLVPGSTSTSYMENKSSGNRKPWADVLVTTCTVCGTSKRFPVGAKRQVRREFRIGNVQDIGKKSHHAIQYGNSS